MTASVARPEGVPGGSGAEPETVPSDGGIDVVGSVRRPPPWWVLVLAVLGWTGLWYLTPGLHGHGLGRSFADDETVVLVETAVAVGLLGVILVLHRRYNRRLFASSRLVPLYAVPVVLAVVLPLHYSMPLPVGLYVVWITVNVFWQDYLTFGLLQSYLGERLPTRVTVPVVAVVFYLGHAIVIPDPFATNAVVALGIVALGLVLALLRARLGTLHLILVLHLSFYFVFA